jgi:hypothetical protein
MSGTTQPVYARVSGGVVAELIEPAGTLTLAQRFPPSVVAECVAVPSGATVAPGDTYTAANGFGPRPAPPALTVPQQALALLDGGIELAITGSMTLTAKFPTSSLPQHLLLALQTVVSGSGAFPGGAAAWPVQDAAGAWHSLTLAQFKPIATAIAAFVAQTLLVAQGAPDIALPSATADVVAG